MILKSLKLRNFLSHEDTLLKFREDQKLLIDGVSGSGKSSLIDGILWALYGKGRMANRSLIKKGARYAEVTLVLHQDGADIRVKRKVDAEGKQTLTLSKDDLAGKTSPIQVTGLKDSQEYIEKKIIGSSYELFINSVVYPQENPDSFVRQNAASRKELLLEIAKAAHFDEYYEKAKDKLIELESEKVHLDAEIALLGHQLLLQEETIQQGEAAEKELPRYQEEVKKFQEEEKLQIEARIALGGHEASLKELVARENEINSELSAKSAEEKNLKEKIETWAPTDTKELEAMVARIPAIDEEFKALLKYDDERDAFIARRMEVLALQPVSHDYEKDIDELNRQLVKEMSQVFPTCPGRKEVCPILTSGRDSRVTSLTQRLEVKKQEREDYIARMESYHKRIEACGIPPRWEGRNRIEIENDSTACRNAERKLSLIAASESTALTTMKANQQSLKAEIERLLEAKETCIAQQKVILDKISPIKSYLDSHFLDDDLYRAARRGVAEMEAKIKLAEASKKRYNITKVDAHQAQEKYKKLQDKISALETLKVAMGPNGIKAVVIDYILPRLEERINSVLEKLSDFRVRLDTQKASVTGEKNIEGLFITIYNGQGESYDFEGYSGGEKLKIVVAISEALAEIQNAKFRILDELFIGLDEESTEKFGDIMMTLQERFSQLVCISHLRSIKTLFNEKVTVSKINGTSKIIW